MPNAAPSGTSNGTTNTRSPPARSCAVPVRTGAASIVEPASVVKRMKDKAFAKGVSRDDLRKGAEELGLPLDEHIGNVIAFMRERRELLGL